MTPEEFKKKFLLLQDEIYKFIAKKAPRLVGKHARDFFIENFRQGGFRDNNLKKWEATKRFNAEGSASQKYGPLLSARTELMNSITYRSGNATVTISSDKEYAQIHNEGGTIDIPVTPKMRKFAWAKHYEETGGKKKENSKWKGLALTKKTNLKVTIPQRQFIGNSATLEKEIENLLETEILKLFNK